MLDLEFLIRLSNGCFAGCCGQVSSLEGLLELQVLQVRRLVSQFTSTSSLPRTFSKNWLWYLSIMILKPAANVTSMISFVAHGRNRTCKLESSEVQCLGLVELRTIVCVFPIPPREHKMITRLGVRLQQELQLQTVWCAGGSWLALVKRSVFHSLSVADMILRFQLTVRLCFLAISFGILGYSLCDQKSRIKIIAALIVGAAASMVARSYRFIVVLSFIWVYVCVFVLFARVYVCVSIVVLEGRCRMIRLVSNILGVLYAGRPIKKKVYNKHLRNTLLIE